MPAALLSGLCPRTLLPPSEMVARSAGRVRGRPRKLFALPLVAPALAPAVVSAVVPAGPISKWVMAAAWQIASTADPASLAGSTCPGPSP